MWQKKALRGFRLYAITDLKTADRSEMRQVEEALKAGVDMIQLRSKTLTDEKFLEIGKSIRVISQRYGKLMIVNDRLDLALRLKADGIHLGQDDLSVGVARRSFNALGGGIVGRSTHSLQQARDAQKEGADYIGFGPLFQTPTKPAYPPIGLMDIARLRKFLRIPFVCIGGINAANVKCVTDAGAQRVAVVRAVFAQASIGDAVKKIKEQLL